MFNNRNSLPTIQFAHVMFRFEKKLESEFYTDFFRNSLGFIRATHILSMLLFAIFGILDIWMLPLSKYYAWFIRYAIICPVIFICFILTFTPFYKKIMQFSLMLKCLVTGCGFAIIIALMRESEPGFNAYYVSIMLVIIACHVLLRIRFVNATIVSVIILGAYELIEIYFHRMLSSPERISIFLNNNFFLLSILLMGMIGSFFIEYFMRNDFLLRKRMRYEEEQKQNC